MIVMFQRSIRLVLLLLTLTVSITAHAQDSKDLKESQDSFTWTGLYFGGNAGGNLSHYDLKNTDAGIAFPPIGIFPFFVPGFDKTRAGFIGGGQIGYNYQLGHLVLGLEGDFDGATSSSATLYSIDGLNTPPGDFFKTERSVKMDWNASARLRAGFALGRFLFYATGGGAFAHLDVHAMDTLTQDVRFLESSSDKTLAGWTAGGGADWAVTKWVTVGLEYRHSGFGQDSYSFASAPLVRPGSANIGFNEDQVTLRVNLLLSGLIGR